MAKMLKKFASYFLSLTCVLSCLVGVSDARVHAVTTEYEAHVAVFCDDTALAEDYVKLLQTYEYDKSRNLLGEPGSGKSNEKVVITDFYGSVKYNVYFHVIDANRALHPDKELNDLIKYCTGAVILYDVQDPAFKPMIDSPTFYKEDVVSMLSIDTPLNNCIKYLQSFGRYGWYNNLNFIMYNSENLTPEEHEKRRSQLNYYTLGLEEYYVGGDNKWSRNHPVWDSQDGIDNVLGWISGEIYRSIFVEKYLTGKPPLIQKKLVCSILARDSKIPEVRRTPELTMPGQTVEEQSEKSEVWANAAYGLVAVAVVAVGCVVAYKLKSN